MSNPLNLGNRRVNLRIIAVLVLTASMSILAWTPFATAATASTSQATGGGDPPPNVGRICLVPGNSLDCPQTLPRMVADSAGHLNVSVNILGSSRFNTFGVFIQWDFPTMNSSSVDMTGTVLPNANVSASCVNNAGIGCTSHDGLGITHFALVGTNTTAVVSGRLFKLPLFSAPGAEPHIGFVTGCSTVSIGALSATGSVANTDLCAEVGVITTTICTSLCIQTLTSVPESIQSQSLGVHLPTPFATSGGNITGLLTAGGGPNFADTWIMPYHITLPGNITSWKAQFRSIFLTTSSTIPSTPTLVQIKVLRQTGPSTLTVVEVGPGHDPRPVLQSRLPEYPLGLTESYVIQYFTDTLLTVLPGDLIGVTIDANPLVAGYTYPLVNSTGTGRIVGQNVTLGGTINLASPFTGTFPGQAPALEVLIQPSPASLDTSGDGIADAVKLSPEMQALGVDPCRKNLLVQLDFMVPASGAYTHRPFPDALTMVTNAFDSAPVPAVSSCPYPGFPRKSSGINLIFDVRNAIPQQDVLNFTHSSPQSFDTLKAQYFDPGRAHYWHYGIFAHDMDPATSVSGVGETFGSNFIVSLGRWTNQVGTVDEQAGTLMHELGHNLGLGHGGADDMNFKPNYLSAMNYEHQVVGIVTRTPTGNVTRFDYSSQALPTLNESNLDEWSSLSNSNDYTRWVCPDHHTTKIDILANNPDWNCDGRLTTGVSSDLNNDTIVGTLTGYNDWANLRFKFVQGGNFNIGCRVGCDIGCRVGCDIGCRVGCDIGTELNFETARVIEQAWAAFLSTPHRSTSTSVNCVPASVVVNTATNCTATVTDVDTGTVVPPTGTVSFKSSLPGSFLPPTCTLSVSGATSSCSVNYTPATGSLGPQTVTAGYTGDGGHLGSNGSTLLNGLLVPVVTVTANTGLTSDLTGRILIASDNVTLNCNGHSVTGITTDQIPNTYPGILLNGRRGVTVENCRVTNFYIGIRMVSSTRNLLIQNNVSKNGYGFLLSSSNLNALLLNSASGNLHDGFRLESSNMNAIAGNKASNNLGSGFLLISSSGNILGLNLANGNGAYGFALTSSSSNNQVVANSACGSGIFDAYQDTTSVGNVYRRNVFCTAKGLPPRF